MIEERDARTLADALVTVSGVMRSQPKENGFVVNTVRGCAAEIDPICDINRSRLGGPMRSACAALSVTNLPAGH